MLDPQQLQHAVELRHQRLHLRHITRLLQSPFSTVARALSRLGLGRLRNLEPKPPVQRYEWDRPGDLIHIDVKAQGRFRKVGHRITGDRQQGRAYGVGYDKVHVAVDDATPLANIEMLADEQKPTVIGFLSSAVAWFNSQGVGCRRVMNDNGPGYVSKAFAKDCRRLDLRHGLRDLRETQPLAAPLHQDVNRLWKHSFGPRLALTSAAARRDVLLTNVVRYNT